MGGIPEEIMVQNARDIGPWRQDRFQRPLDGLLERAPVDFVLHAAGKGHSLEGSVKVPVFPGRRRIADDSDVARIAAAQPFFMRYPDILDFHWIEPHQPCGNRVDCHAISGSQQHVFSVGHHASRPGPVAGERAVHYQRR